MFESEFNFSLDAKHRVSVPSEYRKRLRAMSGSEEMWMCITPKRSIACLPRKGAAQDLRRVTGPWTTLEDPTFDMFRMHFFATARVVVPDRHGRIVVPPKLCAMARLGRNVHWIGQEQWFELWDAQRCDDSFDDLPLDSPKLRQQFNQAFSQVLAGPLDLASAEDPGE